MQRVISAIFGTNEQSQRRTRQISTASSHTRNTNASETYRRDEPKSQRPSAIKISNAPPATSPVRLISHHGQRSVPIKPSPDFPAHLQTATLHSFPSYGSFGYDQTSHNIPDHSLSDHVRHSRHHNEIMSSPFAKHIDALASRVTEHLSLPGLSWVRHPPLSRYDDHNIHGNSVDDMALLTKRSSYVRSFHLKHAPDDNLPNQPVVATAMPNTSQNDTGRDHKIHRRRAWSDGSVPTELNLLDSNESQAGRGEQNEVAFGGLALSPIHEEMSPFPKSMNQVSKPTSAASSLCDVIDQTSQDTIVTTRPTKGIFSRISVLLTSESTGSPENSSSYFARYTTPERLRTLRVFRYVLKLALRSAISVYAVRAATALIFSFSRGLSISSTSSNTSLQRVFRELIVRLIKALLHKDALVLGIFAGACSGLTALTRAILCTIRGVDDQYNKTIAGAIGGLAMFADKRSRRQTLSLYLLARAIYAAIHTGMRTGHIRRMPHMAYWLYALCNGVIGYAFVLQPHLLDHSYTKWIRKIAGVDQLTIDAAVREPYFGIGDDTIHDLYSLASVIGARDLKASPISTDSFASTICPGACVGAMTAHGTATGRPPMYLPKRQSSSFPTKAPVRGWNGGIISGPTGKLPTALLDSVACTRPVFLAENKTSNMIIDRDHVKEAQRLRDNASKILRRSRTAAVQATQLIRDNTNKNMEKAWHEVCKNSSSIDIPKYVETSIRRGGPPFNTSWLSSNSLDPEMKKLLNQVNDTASLISMTKRVKIWGMQKKSDILNNLIENRISQLEKSNTNYAIDPEMRDYLIHTLKSTKQQPPAQFREEAYGHHQLKEHYSNKSTIHSALRYVHPADVFPGVHVGPSFFRSCSPLWHNGHSCLYHHLSNIPMQMTTAMRLYAPVHAVPVLLFRTQQFMKNPVSSMIKLYKTIISSSMFLTTHAFAKTSMICLLRNALGRDTWYTAAIGGASGAIGLYFESPKRVSELMLYCAPRALEVLFLLLESRGLASRIPHGSIVMFCLANALFLSLPRDDFKPAYRALLDFLYGEESAFSEFTDDLNSNEISNGD